MESIFLVDLVREVVERVSVKLTPQLTLVDNLITGVHYQHGHPKEIIENIAELGKGTTTKTSRFPTIALFQDFPEQMLGSGYYADVNLHLIIARATDPNYKADKRYNVNFKPILYPVYQEFINQLKLSRYFDIPASGNFQHTKIDRLYWGREGLYGNEKNVFNDYIDCIEIRDLKLKVKQKRC